MPYQTFDHTADLGILVQADVTDPEQVQAMVDRVVAELGPHDATCMDVAFGGGFSQERQ